MPTNTTTTTNSNNTTGANNNIWLDSIMGRGPTTTTTNSYSIGNGQGMFPSSQKTMTNTGMGGMKQVGLAGMPSMDQWQGGLMHDLNLQNDLNKINFDRNEQAANMFLGMGREGLSNFTDSSKNGQAFFDEARNFQQKGYKESGIAGDKLDAQMKAASKQQDQAHQQALGMYDQGINKIGEGTDKIASAMHAAAARKIESEKDAISNEYAGAFPGSDAQTADLYRAKERDLNEAVFGGVSQIQNQANQMQAQMLAGKGTLAAQLAGTAANFKAATAQASYAADKDQNDFNKMGAEIAMGNATLQFNLNNAFMNAVNNIGRGYGDMINRNPVMGVAVMPTLMAMGEFSKQYGYDNNFYRHPDNAHWTSGYGVNNDGLSALQQQRNRNYAQQQGWNYV